MMIQTMQQEEEDKKNKRTKMKGQPSTNQSKQQAQVYREDKVSVESTSVERMLIKC